MVLVYLCFVVYIVKSYLGYGLVQVDLIQEGNVGLMKVVKCFNLEMGVCLVFFVVYWIKVEIYEFILCNWWIVKVVIIKVQCKLFFNLCSQKKCLVWLNNEEVYCVVESLGVEFCEVCEMESCLIGQDMVFDLVVDVDDESVYQLLVYYFEDYCYDLVCQLEDVDWSDSFSVNLYEVLEGFDECSCDIFQQCWLFEEKVMLYDLVEKYNVFVECIWQLEKNVMSKLKGWIFV